MSSYTTISHATTRPPRRSRSSGLSALSRRARPGTAADRGAGPPARVCGDHGRHPGDQRGRSRHCRCRWPGRRSSGAPRSTAASGGRRERWRRGNCARRYSTTVAAMRTPSLDARTLAATANPTPVSRSDTAPAATSRPAQRPCSGRRRPGRAAAHRHVPAVARRPWPITPCHLPADHQPPEERHGSPPPPSSAPVPSQAAPPRTPSSVAPPAPNAGGASVPCVGQECSRSKFGRRRRTAERDPPHR